MFSAFAFAKNVNESKLEKAMRLMQESTILINEVKANLQEQSLLDPANFQIAIDAIKDGNFSKAKQIFIVFSKVDDDLGCQAFYWLGVCFVEEKNYQKAMLALTTFLNKIEGKEITGKLDDMRKMSYKYLVRCHSRLERPADACAIVDQVAKEYPNEAEYVKIASDALKCSAYHKRDDKEVEKSR